MKKFNTKISKTTYILIVSIMLLLSGCSSDKESKEISETKATETYVYITKTGECYHRSTCSCLSHSKIKRTLSEIYEEYRACQICFPPVVDEE